MAPRSHAELPPRPLRPDRRFESLVTKSLVTNEMMLKFFLLATLMVTSAVAAERVTLRYFDIRGLAEPIRLVLSHLDIDFEEVKYARCAPNCAPGLTDWTAEKKTGTASGLFPFSQVPSLSYGDTNLVQSEAILRFLSRKHDLLGDGSETEQQRIDVFVGGIKDMRSKYGKMAYNKDVLGNPQLIRDYIDTQRTWLPFFERLLSQSAKDGPYVAGKHLTFADFLAFDMVDTNLRVDGQCLDNLPKLKALAVKVSELEGVAKYLSSSRRRPRANGASAAFDNPSNPPNFEPQWSSKSDL